MTPPNAKKAILQRWISQWPALSSGVPYAIDNKKVTGPGKPFAIVEITGVGTDQVTAGAPGARRYQHDGFIDVRLFDERDKGTGAIDALAEIVRAVFQSKRLGVVGTERGVVTYAMSVSELRGDPEFPALFCLLCRTPFYFHSR